jgi:eukaryotic-like serine/threonine-protein kinase
MKQCPVCKREMRDQLLFCPFDGQTLISVVEGDKFIGLILEDKYHIDEKVGEGGMGKVYRATHILMDHTVAIKILHPHLSSDQVAVERFRREARAAVSIRHPNAVAVTDFGVNKESGLSYLVMEFLEGVELRDEIKRRRRLDFEESFIITQQVCLALQAAHSKHIVHRDLKPDNIWLLKSEDGFHRVKVLDFGIAKLMVGNVGNLTQEGVIVGTPYYMSPEQCVGDELDARSDIYSLGIIMYEILTGQVPFRASTPMGVALKQASEPPRPPHELRSDLPYPIENVILRALRKHREDRQSTAMELAHEFESALYQSGVELKFLNTNTPQDLNTLNTHPGHNFGGAVATHLHEISLSPDRSMSPDRSISPDRSTPPDRSIPTNESASSATGISAHTLDTPQFQPAAGTAIPDLFQRWTPSQRSIRQLVSESSTRQKILLVGLAAVLLIATIVAVVSLTRSNQANVGDGNKNGTSNPPAGVKTPANIPPPPPGMVLVEGGKFMRGNPKGDEYEKPVQEEVVPSIYVDQYEVTNKEYYKFVVEKKHYRWPDGWSDSWKAGNFGQGVGEKPVTGITWTDAQAYARGAGKRLPTEVEWEYAARGSSGRLYPWGDDFKSNYANICRGAPVRVGDFPNDKSASGVIGMAGNVSEWTSSADEKTGKKIVRGANYKPLSELKMNGSTADFARVTRWLRSAPEKSYPYIGFRCVKEIPQQ